MPNKYSHALVLSGYERRGLTDFTDFERPRTTQLPPVGSAPSKVPVRPVKLTPQPIDESFPTRKSHPPHHRLRLRDSRDLLKDHFQSQHSRSNNSTDVNTNGLHPSAPQLSGAVQRRKPARKSVDYYDLYTPESPPDSSGQDAQHAPQAEAVTTQKERAQSNTSPQQATPSAETMEISLEDPEWFRSMQRRRRRLTNDTAIWDPQPSSRPQSAQATQPTPDRKSLAPNHPPTPPLTPKARDSWESFSLDTHLDELPPPLPLQHPAHAAQRNSHVTPPDSVSSGSKPSQLARSLSTTSLSHPRYSAGRHRPSHSIPDRRSSLGSLQRPAPGSLVCKRPDLLSLDNYSDTSGRDSLDLDSDLEPLPPDLCNDPEFAALPWTDHPNIPTISHLQHDRPGSRASSFDSAAPPPISLGDRKMPNRRLPAILNEKQPKQLKKPKPSFSFLGAISRASSTPKSIPYNETSPGKAPVPVSVSRTNAPSIPALFSSYRGPFPPNTSTRRPQTSDSSTRDKVNGDRTSTMNSSNSKGSSGGGTTTNKDKILKCRSVRIAGEAFGFRPGNEKRMSSFGAEGGERGLVSEAARGNPATPWAD